MKYKSQKQIYPVYADAEGETLDFYYSRFHQSWNKRYIKNGRAITVKLFNRGFKFDDDFNAAVRRVEAEAKRKNMKAIGMVMR